MNNTIALYDNLFIHISPACPLSPACNVDKHSRRQVCGFCGIVTMASATPASALADAASHIAKGCSDAVLVIIETETGNGGFEKWEGSCPLAAPLTQTASAWARVHSVPVQAVVLEGASGGVLDQSKTPSDYGWAEGQEVRLKCFPASAEFADPEGDDASSVIPQPPSVQKKDADAPARQQRNRRPAAQKATAGSSPAVEAKGTKRGATNGVTPEAQVKNRKAAKATPRASSAAARGAKKSRGGAGSSPAVEAKSTKRGATKDVTPEAEAKERKAARAASRASSAAARGAGRSGGGAGSSPAVEAKGTKRKAAEATSQASKAAAKGAKKSRGEEGNDGPTPGEHEPIEYDQTNFKRPGSSGHERYEKYKKAKTIKEALELGAFRGDIKYDWQRGFYKRK